MKVTVKSIPTLPPGRHGVEPGLMLHVREHASPAWVLRYTFDGRRRDLSLGRWPATSLADAKRLAAQARELLAQGLDPKAVRDAAHAPDATAPLFEKVLDEALQTIADVRRWRNEKHKAQWRSTLCTYVLPYLEGKTVDQITRDDVLQVLRPIWTEKPETAGRVRGRLEAVLDYAIARGLRQPPNPATWRGNLSTFLPARGRIVEERHHKALSFDDLRAVFPSLFASKSVSVLAVAFCILTASRAQEVLGATWGEIDLESATWALKPERTKTLVPHRVPLSAQALDILRRIRPASPDPEGLLFVSPITGHQMAVDTLRKTLRDKTHDDATMHGCRSTFRDWCEEHLIPDALAEKSLSHSRREKTVRAYQRSDLLEQRRPVMQQWADAVLPDFDPRQE